jgi:hypothetical protein
MSLLNKTKLTLLKMAVLLTLFECCSENRTSRDQSYVRRMSFFVCDTINHLDSVVVSTYVRQSSYNDDSLKNLKVLINPYVLVSKLGEHIFFDSINTKFDYKIALCIDNRVDIHELSNFIIDSIPIADYEVYTIGSYCHNDSLQMGSCCAIKLCLD